MSYQEKLIEMKKVLQDSLHFMMDDESCTMVVEIDKTAENLITNGVTVKQMQKPIKRGHLLENSPCWFEARYDDGYFDLEPAEITKGAGANYYIYLIGSETATRMDGKEYGEWWRCWAEKPTEEERALAKWEE